MNVVLINGQPGNQVAAGDRGLHYGDGLFETVSCVNGKPRWLPLHLERLQRGVSRLRLPFDAFESLQAEVGQLAAEQARCLVKVIVTRGTATRRGYGPSGDEIATRIVSRHEWPSAEGREFRVGCSDVPLGSNPWLAGLKHLNRLEQVLAQQHATGRGWHEVLMLSATGQLIGGSMSNVFLATPAELVTPELRDCGVEGVMRRVVMQTAAALNIPVHVRPVAPAELAHVPEIFVTNVRLGVQAVSSYQGRALPSDSVARELQRQIDARS